MALTQMRANRKRAFVSPLAIDELPLVAKLPSTESGDEREVEFDYDRDRWSLADLWGEKNATILPPVEGEYKFPIAQVKDAAGVIRTDVGWRDRRLVQQASSLAIVCPKPPNENRITRGVKEEIEMAVPMGIICRYWQEPNWDPDDFLRSEFPAPGSMGGGQAQALFERKDTLEELIQAAS